ncbi:hypothetical protein HELRODRAFT_191473 [Helobdella robusta]|uniref:Uncharacterized protein n=1 Tax=Helobdella robusta TaxID=6412 RepID=T1FT07_HELRO|nr:hypothetical protein HELRODRAFT_191473 [Helobdella robusta]ESO05425.1 hypothetical protein HELRODRAFT_191473 [Helobdella robusta]
MYECEIIKRPCNNLATFGKRCFCLRSNILSNDLKWLMCSCIPCQSKPASSSSRMMENHTSYKLHHPSLLVQDETNTPTDIYRMSAKLSKKMKNLRLKNATQGEDVIHRLDGENWNGDGDANNIPLNDGDDQAKKLAGNLIPDDLNCCSDALPNKMNSI